MKVVIYHLRGFISPKWLYHYHFVCIELIVVVIVEPSYTSTALRVMCEQHGLVVRAFVMSDPSTGHSKGYG